MIQPPKPISNPLETFRLLWIWLSETTLKFSASKPVKLQNFSFPFWLPMAMAKISKFLSCLLSIKFFKFIAYSKLSKSPNKPNKTIKEVIRGYTGDRKAKQIYSEFDKIDVLKFLKFSGYSFKRVFGDGYLRPFELATFRLNNMNEIIQNWSDYILNEEYLPQRGASFLLNNKNQIIYKFFSNDVLGYSSNMRDPLGFLTDLIKE